MTPPSLYPLISCKRLTENCITRTGVECLIQALEHNTHVKSIWYVMNKVIHTHIYKKILFFYVVSVWFVVVCILDLGQFMAILLVSVQRKNKTKTMVVEMHPILAKQKCNFGFKLCFYFQTACELSLIDLCLFLLHCRLRNNDLSLEEVEEMTQRESRLIFWFCIKLSRDYVLLEERFCIYMYLYFLYKHVKC